LLWLIAIKILKSGIRRINLLMKKFWSLLMRVLLLLFIVENLTHNGMYLFARHVGLFFGHLVELGA